MDTWMLSFSRFFMYVPSSSILLRMDWSQYQQYTKCSFNLDLSSSPLQYLPQACQTAPMLLFRLSPRHISSSISQFPVSSVILSSISSKCFLNSTNSIHSFSLGFKSLWLHIFLKFSRFRSTKQRRLRQVGWSGSITSHSTFCLSSQSKNMRLYYLFRRKLLLTRMQNCYSAYHFGNLALHSFSFKQIWLTGDSPEFRKYAQREGKSLANRSIVKRNSFKNSLFSSICPLIQGKMTSLLKRTCKQASATFSATILKYSVKLRITTAYKSPENKMSLMMVRHSFLTLKLLWQQKISASLGTSQLQRYAQCDFSKVMTQSIKGVLVFVTRYFSMALITACTYSSGLFAKVIKFFRNSLRRVRKPKVATISLYSCCFSPFQKSSYSIFFAADGTLNSLFLYILLG